MFIEGSNALVSLLLCTLLVVSGLFDSHPWLKNASPNSNVVAVGNIVFVVWFSVLIVMRE
jgi:hypothetical protein